MPVCPEKKRKRLLFRVFDNGELVHPVHEGMTLLDNTLELATDTGNQFITGKKIGRGSRAAAWHAAGRS